MRKVVRERPFDTIVFHSSRMRSGHSCLQDRAGVSFYVDASLVYTQFDRMNC